MDVVEYNHSSNNEGNNDITLQEFKELVKKWLEYDNFIKRSKQIIKEKTKYRNELTNIITSFMQKYDIDDLNTSEGRISCKKSSVKKGLTSKQIKEKVKEHFGGNEQAEKKLEEIYGINERVEKVSLSRKK